MKKYRLNEEISGKFSFHSHITKVELPKGEWMDRYGVCELDLEEVQEDILVPDCIKIVVDHGKCIGIMFNNEKQMLWFNSLVNVYSVAFKERKLTILTTPKCKLVKCNSEDLKPGDVAFRSSCAIDSILVEVDLNTLSQYCVVLNDKEHSYVKKKNICVSKGCWNNWYKVTPIN